jgi:hypothetical protein
MGVSTLRLIKGQLFGEGIFKKLPIVQFIIKIQSLKENYLKVFNNFKGAK